MGVKPKFSNVIIKKNSPGSKHTMETLKITYQRPDDDPKESKPVALEKEIIINSFVLTAILSFLRIYVFYFEFLTSCMQHVLTRLKQFAALDGSTCINFTPNAELKLPKHPGSLRK
jgi:hypothetical protein